MVATRSSYSSFVLRSSCFSLVRWRVRTLSGCNSRARPARRNWFHVNNTLPHLRSRSRSCLSSRPHVTSGECAQNASTAQEDADRVPAMQTAKDKGTYLIHLYPSDHYPSLRTSNGHYEVVRVLFVSNAFISFTIRDCCLI